MITLIMHAMSTIHAIKMQSSVKTNGGPPSTPKAWSNLPLDLRIDKPFCFNFVTHAAKTDQRPI